MRTLFALTVSILACSALAQPGTPPPKSTTPPPAHPTPAPVAAQPVAPPAAGAIPVPDGPVVKKSEVDGILIEDIKIGEGYEVKEGGAVVAHYHGTLKDGGKVFDSSFARGEPVPFSLTQVIPGWQKGVPGMKIGGVRRLTIPAALAYGERGNSSVPPNSDLVFIVQLVDAVQVIDEKVGDGEELYAPWIAVTNYSITDSTGKVVEKSDPKLPFIWVPNEFTGLQFGMDGMKIGGKRKIIIPKDFNHSNPQLAPKDRPQGVPCTVEVELLNARDLRGPKPAATTPPATPSGK